MWCTYHYILHVVHKVPTWFSWIGWIRFEGNIVNIFVFYVSITKHCFVELSCCTSKMATLFFGSKKQTEFLKIFDSYDFLKYATVSYL